MARWRTRGRTNHQSQSESRRRATSVGGRQIQSWQRNARNLRESCQSVCGCVEWTTGTKLLLLFAARAQCGCCCCTLLTAVGVGRGRAALAAVINECESECECEYNCECECGCGCSCVQRWGKSRAQVSFVCVNSNQEPNSNVKLNLNPHSTPTRNVNCNVSFINQQKSHFQLLRIRTDTVKPATTTATRSTRVLNNICHRSKVKDVKDATSNVDCVVVNS